MTMHVDLTEESPRPAGDQVAAALDELSVSETLEILAGEDPAVYLNQSRISHEERDLEWEYDRTGPDTWQVSVSIIEDDESLPVFDVRELPPQRRHEVLLETFDDMPPGQGFVLVNDHDPKPLGHELRSTRGETFEWTYREQSAGEWRVAIEKTAQSAAPEDDVMTRFDVRKIPKEERHETIHHRYGMIPEDATMDIIAPHEPRPLLEEFRAMYGESFSWEVVEEQPGEVHVRVRKGAAVVDEEPEASPVEETGEEVTSTAQLDVRDRPPAERHEAIFEAYAELDFGEGFMLVNDHDPKPLYHQFEAEAGDEFYWEYHLKEPGEFRVLIGKVDGETTRASEETNVDPPF